MKCPNCDTKIKEGAKFCKHCGQKIDIDQDEKKNEVKEQQVKKEKLDHATKTNQIKEKIIEEWNQLTWLQKGLTCFGIIVVLSLVIALIGKRTIASIIAMLQLIGLTVIFLIEKDKIKVPKTWIKYVLIGICLIMVFLYIAFFPSSSLKATDIDKIVWDELVIGEVLPEPPKNKGKIYNNSDQNLNLYVHGISSKQFYQYIESCKQKGFDIDSNKEEYRYTAFMKKGYKLELSYNEYNKEMQIELSVQKKLGELHWSESPLASLLPVPFSKTGEIIEDTDKRYQVIVGKMTQQDFIEYVSSCREKGFTYEEDKQDNRFTAKNDQNNKIEIEYLGNSHVQMTITEPEYKMTLKIDFDENWIFSTYDVKLYVDDNYKDTLAHGKDGEYEVTLPQGEHTIRFENTEDDSITGSIKIEVTESKTIELNIHCYNNKVSVENKQEPAKEPEEQPKEPEKPTESDTNQDKETSVSYSTNTTKTVRNGNSGVYAYRRKGNAEYDMYYIIDFDQSYVYFFTVGTLGSETCDRIKMTQGDLNSVLIITYHEGDQVWQEGLHFKYKNHPERMILEDGNHFEYEFQTTNLDEALTFRDQKRIVDY